MNRSGVLVIAHGSRDPKWIAAIDETVQKANTDCSVTIGYLELVAGRSIQDGIEELERKGVARIIVVPLFMTMGSSHLNEIQYMLGLIDKAAIPTDLKPVKTEAKLIWASPLEDHPIVSRIIEARARELSKESMSEIVLLVGHGSDWPGFKERWDQLLQQLGQRLRNAVSFKRVEAVTLNSQQLTRRAKELEGLGRLLVLPLFVSAGYFTQHKIPQALADVNCVYYGKTLLPDPLITNWLEETINMHLINCD
ncbi:hypothetical protein BEP19_16150 [Ammoniphilus oxalaticus]|uniref:Cobalamin biosynthesis protein CbiX n=1 Tax=Ammoniphilus oxalaticus TaxID=66863 RepID=A0A419SQH9_9BACL|nr:CbiX/SirB N-terminal domain-containing protein [Ammoniphilus oxalaticus]RKD26733.1 hypothetical protein BEP19_16150 [Ammoniphilus oxalaticus]